MTIKDTIKSMLINYPLLFSTKLSTYDHLFLVYGNGYEWVDGELVSIEDIEYSSIETGLDKLFNGQYQYDLLSNYLKTTSDIEKIVSRVKWMNERNFILAKRIINYETILNEKLYVTDEINLNPLCEYSQILNVPDDIKDDWKDAIKEFLDFIMTSEDNKIVSYRNQYIHELSEVQYKLL